MKEGLTSEMGTRGLPADNSALHAEISKMIDKPIRCANALKNGSVETIVTCIVEIDDSDKNPAVSSDLSRQSALKACVSKDPCTAVEMDIEAASLSLWGSREADVDRTDFGVDSADARLPTEDCDVRNASLAAFDHALQQPRVPAAVRSISRQQAQDLVQSAGAGQILLKPERFTFSVGGHESDL